MSEARQALLARVVEHVARNGISDVSLRELAAGVGTSHRMLLYHFGSREGLLAAVVASVEAQQRDAMVELADRADDPSAVIRGLWVQVTDPARLPHVRLFFEVLGLALQGRPGTDGFLEGLTEPWLVQGADAAATVGVESSVDALRLGVAVMRGLLIDVLATGDTEAATASLERFIELGEAHALW